MSDIDFLHLRLQIENLIDSRSRLIAENKLLRRKLAKMIQKYAMLENKKDNVYRKLKDVVNQIKERAVL